MAQRSGESFVTDGPDHTLGVMLCVRPDDPGRFVLEGGISEEEIHLTLLYFGTTEEFDAVAAEQATEVINAEISPESKPIHGQITAVTTFDAAGGDEPPLVLLVDAPGLNELHALAQARLRSALGSDTQPRSNHGFMPHITLGYGADEVSIEAAKAMVGEPVEFSEIEFVWGTETSVWGLGKRHDGASISDGEEGFGLQLKEIPDPRPDVGESYAEEADGMPYEIVDNHPECGEDEPVAVVKKSTGEVMGCHADSESAARQIAAIEANEAEAAPREARLGAIDEFLAGAAPAEAEFAPVVPVVPGLQAPAPEMEPEEGITPPHENLEGEICPGSGEPCTPDEMCPECGMPVEDMEEVEEEPEEEDHPMPMPPGSDMAKKRCDVEVDEEFAASGVFDLAVADLGRPWGNAEARKHLQALGAAGEIGFLYGGMVPFADVIDGEVVIVPKGVFAAAGRLEAFDAEEEPIVKTRLAWLYSRIRGEFGDLDIKEPWAYDASDHSEFSALPVHHSATTDSKDFDGDVVKTRTRSDESPAYYGGIYAWHDSTDRPGNKTSYRFPHHQVDEAGNAGAAVDWACRAALMLIDDSGIPRKDYQGVYNHLAAHLKDAGMEVPELGEDNLSAEDVLAAVASMAPTELATTVEEEAMAPFDVTNIEDTALIGEFIRRWVESVSGRPAGEASEADEFAPKKGVNPFPPKKKADEEDPESKAEAPAPDAEEDPDAAEEPDPEDPEEEKEPEEAAPKAPAAKPAPVAAPMPPMEGPDKKKRMIGQGTGTFEWEGVLIVEGIPSGDGRMIDQEALTWRELPLPLMLQTVNAEGHSGAVIAGSIHEIERVGQDIVGRGNFDSGPAGQEARRLLSEGTMRGVSADIDSVMVDLRDSSGNAVNMEDVLFGEASAMEVLVQGRIMGATLTPFPAFQEAHIEVLDNAAEDPALVAAGSVFDGEVWRFRSPYPICVFGVHEPVELTSLVASAGNASEIPLNPPMEWFAMREMDEPMPFTVYPDGRCFGLVAAFGSCHIGFRNKCVEVPKSMSNYRYFRNKRTLTSEGEMIATGPIFMDTVHPNLRLRASDAEAHYAHTGCAVADVALYENEHGIVAAGAIRPDATPEQIRRLRGSDISPDWRSIKGKLELVGLLGVNVSGFITPALAASGGDYSEANALVASMHRETLTPRAQINVATDEVESLVAAGSLGCGSCGQDGFSLGSDAVAQIIEMLSSHEAKLSELSRAIRPMRAEHVLKRAAGLSLGASKKDEEEGV